MARRGQAHGGRGPAAHRNVSHCGQQPGCRRAARPPSECRAVACAGRSDHGPAGQVRRVLGRTPQPHPRHCRPRNRSPGRSSRAQGVGNSGDGRVRPAGASAGLWRPAEPSRGGTARCRDDDRARSRPIQPVGGGEPPSGRVRRLGSPARGRAACPYQVDGTGGGKGSRRDRGHREGTARRLARGPWSGAATGGWIPRSGRSSGPALPARHPSQRDPATTGGGSRRQRSALGRASLERPGTPWSCPRGCRLIGIDGRSVARRIHHQEPARAAGPDGGGEIDRPGQRHGAVVVHRLATT